MPYIDLVPYNISVSNSSGVLDPYNVISSDDIYTTFVSGTQDILYVRFDNPSLPQNTSVTGLEVFYSAKAASAISNAALSFNYFISNSLTLLASSQISTGLAVTEVSSAVGASGSLFGYPLRRIDIHGNPWFGISVTPASTVSTNIFLDNITVRVWYSSSSYLTGTRSRFSNQPGTLYDVTMVNGIVYEASSIIERKYNGASIENQIKSEDLNLLGDCLYNIESAIISSSGLVYTTDGKKTYVFSLAASANYNTAGAGTDVAIFAKVKKNGSVTLDTSNLSNAFLTGAPILSGGIACYFTSAIGWVEDGAGNKHHMYVHPGGAYFKRNGSNMDFAVTLSALGSAIGTVSNYEDLEGSSGAYQGYVGTVFTEATAPSGKIFFKVFCMGREN